MKADARLALALLSALLLGGCGDDAASYEWDLPEEFPLPRVPDDNPMSEAKVALGRSLFYDVRLSGNETQSCGSCHVQSLAFTDALDVSVGSTGEHTPRGSMALGNVAYAGTLTWANPTLVALEEQALVPMFGENPVELGLANREDELLARMHADARYPEMFALAFPDKAEPIDLDSIIKAIGAFERTLISASSPYDHYNRGETSALDASALRGMELFFGERLECFHCHGGFNFSGSVDHAGNVFDQSTFQNNGLYNVDGMGSYPAGNEGLYDISGVVTDRGRFKPPTLRNIALTAPYMHDGSLATLDAVLDHYIAGGTDTPSGGDGRLNPNKSAFVRGFTLTVEERADLLAFLESLTDQEFITDPRFSDPFATP